MAVARSSTSPTTSRPAARPPARSGWRFDGPFLKTIDRYVLGSFLKNYLISLLVLIGLYVVLDMVFNFDEFVQVSGREGADEAGSVWQTIRHIADFYFFQSFRVFSYLAGVIPVVATAFTLMRMSRFNELAALLAAGVPLRRIAYPVVMAAFILNLGLLVVNQELIVPSVIDKLTRDRDDINDGLQNRVLQAMPDGPDALLFAGRYIPRSGTNEARMEVIDVLSRREDGQRTHLSAESAVYDAASDSWTLTNGAISDVARRGATSGDARPVESYKGTANPETIALFVSRGDFVDLLSSKRIGELIAQKTSVGRIDLMRVRDARFANYVLNIVLVLLTIPCVLTREPMQLRTAAARVFVLVGACMATIFVCQSLAGQPPPNVQLASMWTAIMAWLPIFIFMPIVIWLLDRLKT